MQRHHQEYYTDTITARTERNVVEYRVSQHQPIRAVAKVRISYQRLSEKLMRGGPTACGVPGDTGPRPRRPGVSQFRPHPG